jgi:hypothetical protein
MKITTRQAGHFKIMAATAALVFTIRKAFPENEQPFWNRPYA